MSPIEIAADIGEKAESLGERRRRSWRWKWRCDSRPLERYNARRGRPPQRRHLLTLPYAQFDTPTVK